MNLYIDIGNTSTVFGFSKNRGIYSVLRIKTSLIGKLPHLKKEIRGFLKKEKADIRSLENIIICTVVPKAQIELKKQLNIILPKSKVSLIGKDININIKNKYKVPKQVGLDRLVNALAVKAKYLLPALVVDFGTAITIDAISEKAEYLGGVIVPGINLSLMSLHKNTALLPKLEAHAPRSVLGRDTENSILSGIFHGYAALVDGLIEKLNQELKGENKKKILVIATGGHLNLMKKLCKSIDAYDSSLTLKGIEIAYLDSK